MSQQDTDRPYWVALASHPRIGAQSFKKLSACFASMEKVWRATPLALSRAGFPPGLVEAVLEVRSSVNPEKLLTKLRRHDVGVVTLADQSYPRLLREIPDPPGVLFVRGQLQKGDELAMAVVGSRKYSAYGKEVTETIVPALVASGLTIVSGLALGIDSIAHLATLSAGGRTLAVLPCGIDQIYPAAHHAIAQKILDGGGALLSEFPLGTISYPSNFPIRNRIIAGLSLGTLIVEAALDSGSLLTAKAALDYNREVFAVPGDLFRQTSQGTNNLLKMGAKVVTGAEDILAELSINKMRSNRAARRVIPETAEEAVLLPLLGSNPMHVDALVKASKMKVEAVGSAMILMEMKGKVRNVGGNQYVKA